eukprot:1928920-Prymnesium_polylepis.4
MRMGYGACGGICVCSRWPKNPKVIGLMPLGRPDLRGLDSWRFWCPRGLAGTAVVRVCRTRKTAVRTQKGNQKGNVARVRSPCGKSAEGRGRGPATRRVRTLPVVPARKRR